MKLCRTSSPRTAQQSGRGGCEQPPYNWQSSLAGLESSSGTESATFRTQASATLDLAWLFVVLPPPHFSLQATSFNKLSEPANRLLNRFAVANSHANH
jgi:hypothetical protein